MDELVLVPRAGLQHDNLRARIGAEPIGNDRAGGPGPHNDVVGRPSVGV